jgi:hypothetical protein
MNRANGRLSLALHIHKLYVHSHPFDGSQLMRKTFCWAVHGCASLFAIDVHLIPGIKEFHTSSQALYHSSSDGKLQWGGIQAQFP